MVVLWYLLVLAPFIAIPILWWSYRRRQAERERLAEDRWKKIASQSASGEAASAAVVLAQQAAAAPAPPAHYQRRDRLLDPSQTLMYYLLRTGLPDCEVLTQVSLDRLLTLPADTAGAARESRLRALAQHAAAFVICNKAMQPLAAVDLLDGEAPAALTAAPDFRTQCFAHSGVRYVRIARTALPKRHEVRAMVLGEAAGA